jgi:putative phosphonate metabolism protein
VSGAPRYAIYFLPPPDSVLYRLGSALIGYDAYSGAELPPPPDADLPTDWAALTEEPRRYGFHATLKAPFRLAPGCDEAGLRDAVQRIAAEQPDIPSIPPVVRSIGGFVAIVPDVRVPALDRLAADCVTRLDRFRAPLTAAERARRLPSIANERERENLEQWGYPYVFGAYRFHMTLTGRLPDERRPAVVELMAALVARHHGDAALAIDRIVLLRQDAPDARLRVLATAPLCEPATAPAQPG